MRIFLSRGLKWPHGKAFLESLSEGNIEVVYNTVSDEFLRNAKSLLSKDHIPANYWDQHRGVLPESLVAQKVFPEARLLEEMKACLDIFFPMMERLNYANFRAGRIYEFYLRYVVYWLTMIRVGKPDAVVFGTIPHEGADFVLYYIASILKIPTLIIERTIFHDSSLLLKDIYNYPQVPDDYNGTGEIDNTFHEAYLAYQKRTLAREKKTNRNAFKRLLKALPDFYKNEPVVDTVYSLMNTRPAYLSDQYNRFRANLKSKKSLDFYNDYAIRPSREKKSVYFPLHFEPEKSTLPMGGKYWNQLYVLEMLLQALPKDWIIYVKEHPRQFDRSILKNELARDLDFYKRLLADSRIQLLDLSVSSDEMFAISSCITTITGTVGWEAIQKEVPVLVWGYPWYRDCPEICFVNEVEEASAYLKTVDEEAVAIDIAAIKRYAGWIKNEVSYSGSNVMSIYTEVSEEENERNLGMSVVQGFRDLYSMSSKNG